MINQSFQRMFVGLIAIAVLAAGCERNTPRRASGEDKNGKQATNVALPPDLFVETAPANALNVAEATKSGSSGQEIVMVGRIGGRRTPFVEGAAMFLLTDARLKSCQELHANVCPTPWDYCCEPQESLKASIATIQIVDDNGKPLRIDIKSRHGLDPLARVTVVGTIESAHEGTPLIINARKIHVAADQS